MAEPRKAGARPGTGLDAELRFRALFAHTNAFTALLDIRGHVLDANPHALSFLGLGSADVIGQPLWDLPGCRASESSRQRLRTATAECAAGRSPRLDLSVPRQDGRILNLDVSFTPVRENGEHGPVVILIVEGRDFTEAGAAERQLRESEARFSGIVSIASDAIISVDDAQRIVLFNRGAEAIFGWSADEVMNKPLDMLLPDRFRAMHREHIRRFSTSPVSARRMGERQEISALRKSGEVFPAEASISKIDVDGRRFFTVVLRDATERKRVELAQRFLVRAGQMLATSLDLRTTLHSVASLAVEFVADVCVIYDAGDGGMIRRLEAASRDPRWRPLLDDLVGTPLDARTPHPVVATLETGVAELIPDLTEGHHDVVAAEPAMRLFREMGVTSAMLVPLVARDRIIGAVGFYSIASHRRYDTEDLALAQELSSRAALAVDNARLYREAQDALQARDDVLAVVSHDLGNPLAAIRIGTTLLLRSLPPEERGRGGWQHLEGIRHSAEQMERLVNDLLEVKRIEAGHMALRTERYAVNTLATEVFELFQPIAAAKNVQLAVETGAPGLAVLCDPARTLQVFSNLVGNAIKFTPEGGLVKVRATAQGPEVLFAVSDTGPGISEEHLPHVFDRFWQAHRSNREGIGLGLAIVKGILQAHGGRIWVESGSGGGTTFFFTLANAGEDTGRTDASD
jgi:PAS domain S-box-containing protein